MNKILLSALISIGLISSSQAEIVCNPVSLNTCALPFPSDIFSVADAKSPTGKRIVMGDEVFDASLVSQFPASVRPGAVYANSSGFSAATPVLFELASDIDIASLPADGGDTVIAIDVETGQRAPITAKLSSVATSPFIAADKKSVVVEVWPRARWEYRHRYAVALLNSLKAKAGGSVAVTPNFKSKVLDGADGNLAAQYAPALAAFNAQGVDRNNIINATYFTIRDAAEVQQPLIDQTTRAFAQEHPVRNLKMDYGAAPGLSIYSVKVAGEIRLTDFRRLTEDGRMDFNDASGRENWVSFILYLPFAAEKKAVPVVVYGHGLTGKKEDVGKTVLFPNSIKGVATLVIDQPNHGSRIYDDGGFIGALMIGPPFVPKSAPANVARFSGMMAQSPIDFVSIVKALQTSLSKIDVAPKNYLVGTFPWLKYRGNRKPDIDVSRIYYEGTSLGAVLGSSFVALSPDVKAAFYQVPGVGVTHILSQSVFWSTGDPNVPGFGKAIPVTATGAQAIALLAYFQQTLDYADGINFAGFYRNSQVGNPVRPVSLVFGSNDPVVGNDSTKALMELTDMGYLHPESVLAKVDAADGSQGVFNLPAGLREQSGIGDGFAALQVQPASGESPHGVGNSDLGLDYLNRWLSEVVVK